MKKLLRAIYTVPVFISLGQVLFSMSRVDWLEPASLRMARFYAGLVHWTYGRRPQTTARELANEWNRLMPRPRSAFPVVNIEDDTAFVEIHVACPLRGTGNAEACWRAMEFDRALVAGSGGRLVVMESQSVTGGSCCKLAIRPAGSDIDDLPAAHPRWRNS